MDNKEIIKACNDMLKELDELQDKYVSIRSGIEAMKVMCSADKEQAFEDIIKSTLLKELGNVKVEVFKVGDNNE